jgi:hypothetical protein
MMLMLFACVAQPPTSGPEQPLVPPPVVSESSIPNPTEISFFLTKIGGLTVEAETQMALNPKNDATITAIIATKFAAGTQVAETAAAMPTQTPTPAIPSDSPLCSSADLKANFSSTGSTGNALFFINLTNISNKPCCLQALPQAKLIDAQGNPLDVDYNYQPMSADQAASAMKNKVGLFPQRQASFTTIWSTHERGAARRLRAISSSVSP